jgi:pimeloyl-ACP methyl ester carboxylesterase
VTGFGPHDGDVTSPMNPATHDRIDPRALRAAPTPPREPTDFPEPTLISVNGVELEVFEAGRENAGRPIVLCHGWPEHAFSWRHQMPALAAAGYHVIVPNQRGYGNSSRPAEVTAYDIEHLSGDLIALLDHYGYEDATFVGHDWGAMVVWGLTLLHPRRVQRLINLSLPSRSAEKGPGSRSWRKYSAATSTLSISIDSQAWRTPYWKRIRPGSSATCTERTSHLESRGRE